jgi:hypothetical protein
MNPYRGESLGPELDREVVAYRTTNARRRTFRQAGSLAAIVASVGAFVTAAVLPIGARDFELAQRATLYVDAPPPPPAPCRPAVGTLHVQPQGEEPVVLCPGLYPEPWRSSGISSNIRLFQ